MGTLDCCSTHIDKQHEMGGLMRWSGRVVESMPGALAEGIDALSREEALDVFGYLCAVFQKLIGNSDVCTLGAFTLFQRS